MNAESLEKGQRITVLLSQAKAHHEEAISLADVTRKSGNEAIKAALLAGKALNEAKTIVGHGRWLLTLKERCPALSHDTASKYMRLANFAHERNLESCHGLRQAYLICGILPEPEAYDRPPEPPTPAERLMMRRVLSFTTWFKGKLDAARLDALEAQERAKMKEELRPLVEVYERL